MLLRVAFFGCVGAGLAAAVLVVLISFRWWTAVPRSAEILVLGDSQLSFGAGPVLSTFFADLPNQCRREGVDLQDVSLVEGKRFSMLGTRSTSLKSWISTEGAAFYALCQKDKVWGVNASTWGEIKPPERRYVQVGEGNDFQFCRQPEVPLRNLFADGYYTPQLLMVFVGGNGAERLAGSTAEAEWDVDQFVANVPKDTACLFMMTAPVFERSQNDVRLAAQANLRAAFARHEGRCTFVEGHTPATRAAIEGQRQFFRQDDKGAVTDPYHANEDAARAFLSLRKRALCWALVRQFRWRSGRQRAR